MENSKQIQLSPSATIFTTGAYLRAFEVEINGIKQWRWIVVGQEDEAYYDGNPIDIFDYANSFEGLFQEEQPET